MTDEQLPEVQKIEFDWTFLTDCLSRLYGPGCFEVTPDNTQVYVYIPHNMLYAIFQKATQNSPIGLHVRASIPLYSALKFYEILIGMGLRIRIGDIFEIHHSTREVLHGLDAMKYVAQFINMLWFGKEEEKETRPTTSFLSGRTSEIPLTTQEQFENMVPPKRVKMH